MRRLAPREYDNNMAFETRNAPRKAGERRETYVVFSAAIFDRLLCVPHGSLVPIQTYPKNPKNVTYECMVVV